MTTNPIVPDLQWKNCSFRLEISQLLVRRNQRPFLILDELLLTAGAKAIFSGPNGAGKTTLLNTIAGLEGSAQCVLHSSDKPLRHLELHRATHFLPSPPPHCDIFSVGTMLRFMQAALHPPAQPSADIISIARSMNLPDPTRPLRLCSQGEKKRLALCALLLAPRPLWLLDEPETSLDPQGLALLHQLCANHARAGGIACIATASDSFSSERQPCDVYLKIQP